MEGVSPMTIEELKRSLHIDGEYNDIKLYALMDGAKASLYPTIGYSETSKVEDSKKFDSLLDIFITEYVRGLYYHIDNQKVTDALQMQLQAMIIDEVDSAKK